MGDKMNKLNIFWIMIVILLAFSIPVNALSIITLDSNGWSSPAQTQFYGDDWGGTKIQANYDVTLLNITSWSVIQLTKCRLLNSTYGVLASGNFDGKECPVNYPITKGTIYYAVTQYSLVHVIGYYGFGAATSPATNTTNIYWFDKGFYQTAEHSEPWQIQNITTERTDLSPRIDINSPLNNTEHYIEDTLSVSTTTENFMGVYYNTTQTIYDENGTIYLSLINSSTNMTNGFLINTTGQYFINATVSNGTYLVNSSTYTFTVVATNHVLNITAINSFDSSPISSFNLTVNDTVTNTSTQYSTGTNNYAEVDAVKNRLYTITIDNPRYALATENITIPNNASSNYVFSIYGTNSLYITIFNENTGAVLSNTTINLSLTNSYGTTTNSTNTGILFLTDLVPDTYTITITNALYNPRTYTVTVGNRSAQTLNAYLSQSAVNVIFSYVDRDTALVLENVSVSISKEINGTWTLLENRYTDITGRVQFTVDTNTNYRFISIKSGYDTKTFNLNPVLFTSYNVALTKNTATNIPLDYQDIGISYNPTSFIVGLNNFTFDISSPSGDLNSFGYNLSWDCGSTFDIGTNSYGDVLNGTLNTSCLSTYSTIRLFYYYILSDGSTHNFTRLLGITGRPTGDTTLSTSLKSTTYGMGLFERILITVVITLILMGVVGAVGGTVSSLVVGLIILTYLTSVGFIPYYVIIITLFVGFVIISSYNTR